MFSSSATRRELDFADQTTSGRGTSKRRLRSGTLLTESGTCRALSQHTDVLKGRGNWFCSRKTAHEKPASKEEAEGLACYQGISNTLTRKKNRGLL